MLSSRASSDSESEQLLLEHVENVEQEGTSWSSSSAGGSLVEQLNEFSQRPPQRPALCFRELRSVRELVNLEDISEAFHEDVDEVPVFQFLRRMLVGMFMPLSLV